MNSSGKFINIKVVELIKMYNFYFDHFFVRQSDSVHCSQIYISRNVNLWTMYTTTLLDEEMTKIKIVDLEKLHNFVVDNFLSWNHFVKENYVWISKISIFKKSSNGEITKMKVVDLEKLCNYLVDNFFIWNHLVKKNYVWISHIWNLNFSNDLGWRNV